MFAIYKREFKAYINSFIGLLFMAVSLFFVGIYYTVYQLIGGSPYFSITINSVMIVFLISVPVFCMKVFAEERHNKTDQLTLTAPVTVGQIVMGKYLALLSIFGITTLIICVYPLIMSAYGKILIGETYVAILGYFLYGAAAIAIGVLISALTESQVIAAVLGFGVLLLGNIMASLCSFISSKGNIITQILCAFDMSTPFTQLLNGVLDIKAIIYFVTLIGLSLFLTTQVIQKRRYSVSVKQISMGAYSTGMIAIVAVLAVVVNVFLGQLPSTWTIIDCSSQKLYSITDTTKDFLDTLEQDVDIYVMVNEENADKTIAHTLSRYDDYSEHVTVTYVDPAINPTFVTKYTNESIMSNSVIVESDLRHKVIDFYDLWLWSASGEDLTIAGYDAEGQITGAIGYVTSEEEPKVYVTSGHDEAAVPEAVLNALGKESIKVETISLKEHEAIPEDAHCLFIHAPALDFNADEAQMVIDYLAQGGTVIFVTGTVNVERPYCDSILEYMGLEIVDGMIVEGNTDFYLQNQLYLVPNVSSTVYTEGIYNQYDVLAPYAQGLATGAGDYQYINYTTLLNTSQKSFSKVDLYSTTIEQTEQDIEGPFVIGVEAQRVNMEATGVMIAYSCSPMFTDEISAYSNGTNQMLLVDTISACVNTEMNITIPEKSYLVNLIIVPNNAVPVIGAFVSIILPVAILVSGFVIWFKRRRR